MEYSIRSISYVSFGETISAKLCLLRLQIERELILSSADKNSKIPILHEYKQRTAGRVAIAPDAPIKQQAWVQEVSPIFLDNSRWINRADLLASLLPDNSG